MRNVDMIRVADLSTEDGACAAAVKMAQTVCKDLLWPVINHTPKEMRQVLFERFLSGLTGAMCAELGPERAKESLDAVKLAIDDLVEGRKNAH